MDAVRFYKSYGALYFHMESLKIDIFKVFLLEGKEGLTKTYSVYAFNIVDNSRHLLVNSRC